MRARPGTPRSIEHQHLRKSTGADGFVSSSIPPVDLAAAPRGLRHFPSRALPVSPSFSSKQLSSSDLHVAEKQPDNQAKRVRQEGILRVDREGKGAWEWNRDAG
jgi:hypothetical protein